MRPSRFAVCAAPLIALFVLPVSSGAQPSAAGVSATSAIYVRSDSDHTTVVAPRLHVAAPLDSETRLDLVYTTDVWSSASIDIRTAATKRVVEQRDEIDVALDHSFEAVTLAGSYRYSIEHDYESHGGGLGATIDLAQHSTTLSALLHATLDRVGKAGDPLFDRQTSVFGARVALTQVIDTQMFGELVYELGRHAGYLASPYRNVRIADDRGTQLGTCRYPATVCESENNPTERLRHAFAINVRRALGEAVSLGGHYRFYIDDWHVQSHTFSADIKLLAGSWLFGLDYRFYQQTAASHYRPFYPVDPLPTLRTSDKELSALSAHRVELEVSHSWLVDATGTEWRTVLLVAPSYFHYEDFPWLHSIRAFEATLALELRL